MYIKSSEPRIVADQEIGLEVICSSLRSVRLTKSGAEHYVIARGAALLARPTNIVLRALAVSRREKDVNQKL